MLKDVNRPCISAVEAYNTSMILAKKSVPIVIALLVIALAGLLAVQILLLNYAIELKDQAFSRNVLSAMSTVAQQVEAFEMAQGVSDVLMFETGINEFKSGFDDHQILIKSMIQPGSFFESGDSDSLKILALDFRNESVFTAPEVFSMAQDSFSTLTFIVQTSQQEMMRKVVTDLTLLSEKPITQRLISSNLDSLLTDNLLHAGINIAHQYGVLATASNSLVMESGQGHFPQLLDSTFKTRLFPLDLRSPNYDLVVHFPDNRAFLYKQVWPLLASSIVFSLLILGSFAHTIRTISAQQRLSSQLVDFINNMTHEFKTPISTVALACEAIARPDVLTQQDTLLRYNQMISDENARMHKQVEKILQMAQLERGDYDLKIQTLDIHQLIASVSDSFLLQLEQRQGQLDLKHRAACSLVKGDHIHLTNVIQNLIDNAIKYSPTQPDIGIKTWNEKQEILIRISDKGSGVIESDHKRVFEKYYRCPTGNRHDVKGFGIGLSYVKLIIEAHRGTIGLTSKPGSGTEITFRLPLEDNQLDLLQTRRPS